MFEIMQLATGAKQLVSSDALSTDDFAAISGAIGLAPFSARKIGFVAARVALAREAIETRWNGKESHDVAAPGDVIVTNMGGDGQVLRDNEGRANTYVIRSNRFPDLYEPTGAENEFGKIYRAKGRVMALFLDGGFDILAPWGERQQAEIGYLICNGPDVYGNARGPFEATYEAIA